MSKDTKLRQKIKDKDSQTNILLRIVLYKLKNQYYKKYMQCSTLALTTYLMK